MHRERERGVGCGQTERQTQKQSDRDTNGQTERQTDRQTNRETDKSFYSVSAVESHRSPQNHKVWGQHTTHILLWQFCPELTVY